MSNAKPFLDSDITLPTLAKNINVSVHRLSQIASPSRLPSDKNLRVPQSKVAHQINLNGNQQPNVTARVDSGANELQGERNNPGRKDP